MSSEITVGHVFTNMKSNLLSGLSLVDKKEYLIEHYQPPFCILQPVLNTKIGEITKRSWESIVSGEAEGFRRMKATYPQLTPLTYFYDRFYSQLFFLYPECRPFFQSSLSQQGRRLVKSLMGLASLACFEKETVHSKLVALAVKHNEKGIHPQMYGGFMWNILMTLRHCLGQDWTPEVEEAWIISASYMLRVMVPIAVEGTESFASPYAVPKYKNNLQLDKSDACGLDASIDPLFGYQIPEEIKFDEASSSETPLCEYFTTILPTSVASSEKETCLLDNIDTSAKSKNSCPDQEQTAKHNKHLQRNLSIISVDDSITAC
jgi:hemoglobin-like flavoprotein